MRYFKEVIDQNALVLLALAGLGVVMPLLDIFGGNPQFFVAKDHRGWEVFIFGLVVAFLIPLAVLLIEFLARRLHAGLGQVFHIVLVAGLGLLLALAVLRKLPLTSDLWVWTIAGIAGLLILLCERLWKGFRDALRFFAFSPLLAFLLFIFFSASARLIWVGEAHAEPLPGIENPAPIVMLVFDEFPIASLLAEDGNIDTQRFPNFARLADQSYWFRNNTTVVPWTAGSITIALTGNTLEGEKAPNSIEYPRNLFTLLGDDYEMSVYEEITQLCPNSICDQPLAVEGSSWTASTPVGRLHSSLLDAALVYAHATLPPGMRAYLPSINHAFGGFFGQDAAEFAYHEAEPDDTADTMDEAHLTEEHIERPEGGRTAQAQSALIESLIASIEPVHEPALYFMHVVFPHFPWELTPSGYFYEPQARVYDDLGAIPGLRAEGDHWGSDAFLVRQGFQRHLMQVGYVDYLLGKLIDRMQAAGLWERAVFVVIADHGVSFVPDQPRRGPTPQNMDEIYRVPFFLKLPDQNTGEIRDDVVSLLDLMPTLVDALGVETDWDFEGRSLLGDAPPPAHRVLAESPENALSNSLDGLLALAKRNAATFNRVDGWLGVAAVGEHGDLIGTQVDDLGTGWRSDFAWSLDQASAFENVDFSTGYAPVLVTGKLNLPAEMGLPGDVLIVVNDVVAGIGGGFICQDSECQFSALLAEELLQEGQNQVAAWMATSASQAISTQPDEPPPLQAPPDDPDQPAPYEPPIGGPEIQVLRGLEYARVDVHGDQKQLLLDLYLPPEGVPRPLPLLIYIHGGGWMDGSREDCPGRFAAEHSFAIACVDYRLSYEAHFPAQIRDVKAAVRWLRVHADFYHLDPGRFGAWGDSAGGHLAALLGTSAGVPDLEGDVGVRDIPSDVQAVVDWYGPTDFSRVPPAFVEPVSHPIPPEIFERYEREPWFEYTLATTLLLGGPVETRFDLAMLANPIAHVDPHDPPFLILHGEQDEIVPFDQSIFLLDALLEKGVEVVFVPDPERGHWVSGPEGMPYDPGLLEMALGFFDAHLRH